jgi:hypothetical protein
VNTYRGNTVCDESDDQAFRAPDGEYNVAVLPYLTKGQISMPKLEEVFGVSAKPIRSYVERNEVDTRFREALESDKQIIVYGSSKQGKTALVSKYLPYEKNLLVSLTPKTTVVDIYHTVLAAEGIRLATETTEKRTTDTSLGFSAKVKAMIPIFGSGEAGTQGEVNAGSEKERKFEEVPINLELPQHVAELLKRVGSKKWIILENFHYLNDEIQKQFAFDLRAFQELGVRFVVLGVWREKNRMAQFNGDLLDRVVEVPVEPWIEVDFKRVAAKGGEVLAVEFSDEVLTAAIRASFSSIGVFQELLKGICIEAGILETQPAIVRIADLEPLNRTIPGKARDYSARHQRALEAIAAGHTSGGAKGNLPPLYLPYYLVRVVLEGGFEGIANGMRRSDIHDRIRAIHHRGNDVRASDMSNLLSGLANLQAVKSISPPIIDYDSQNRLLQVVDSTFYFFIKNSNAAEILESIQNPLDAWTQAETGAVPGG